MVEVVAYCQQGKDFGPSDFVFNRVGTWNRRGLGKKGKRKSRKINCAGDASICSNMLRNDEQRCFYKEIITPEHGLQSFHFFSNPSFERVLYNFLLQRENISCFICASTFTSSSLNPCGGSSGRGKGITN